MKKIFFFILTICFVFQSKAQSLVWAKQLGGFAADNGQSIKVDASGNVYSSGYFQNFADFDPGPGSYTLGSVGSNDIYISKLDAAGNFLWAVSMGGVSSDLCQSLAIDAQGNVFTTGSFQGTVDFDPGPGTYTLASAGGSDIFVSKLDALGNFVWAKKIGGVNPDMGVSITIDASGKVYCTGNFVGLVDFDPGPATAMISGLGLNDIFILKLDALGNYVWAKNLSGTADEFGNSIAVDVNGNVYTTGRFTGTTDFDPGAAAFNLSTAGLSDIFISKLDVLGNFVWAKKFGGGNTDVGYAIELDAAGNPYLTGWFMGTVDFDPSPAIFNMTTTGAFFDAYVSKFDVSGNFIWSKQIGGGANDAGQGISIDASGNVYTCGYFEATADFDPSPLTYTLSSAGAEDIYISKLDPSGNFIWTKQFSGPFTDIASSIDVDAAGYIYTTGIFNSTADFDPEPTVYNLISSGGTEIFVHKMFVCITAPTNSTSIIGPTLVCSGSSVVYSAAPVIGAFSYTWSIPGGWTGSSSNNTIIITPNASSGSISVIAGNSCGNSAPQVLSIISNTIPALPNSIVGNTIICSGSTNIYSISPVAGATSYTWAAPLGWTGNSLSNTLSVMANSTSGNMSVTAINMCGSSAIQTLSINVFSIPITPSAIIGNTIVCQGANLNYSVAAVPGATSYFWSLPLTWSGSSQSNTINVSTGTSGGNISVIAGNVCYNSLAQNLNVNVYPSPTISVISSNSIICFGSAQSVSLTASGAGSYTWTPGGTGTVIIVAPGITSTYSVNGIDGNNCLGSALFTQSVVLCTGIESNAVQQNEVMIFPNPFTTKVMLVTPFIKTEIKVFNALGELIYNDVVNNNESEIDLKNCSPGVYFVHAIENNNAHIIKVVKQ